MITEAKRLRDAKYRRKLKLDMVAAYGGKCAECGCTNPDELELDHKEGLGNKERNEIFHYGHASPGGWNFYLWLKKHGWPQEGYKLMCEDCHTKKHPWRKKHGERKASPGMQYPQEVKIEDAIEKDKEDPVPF